MHNFSKCLLNLASFCKIRLKWKTCINYAKFCIEVFPDVENDDANFEEASFWWERENQLLQTPETLQTHGHS